MEMQSLAKIEEIHAPPLHFKAGQVKSSDHNTGRARIKNSHLPAGTTERFTKNVLPIALDTAGALAPWDHPDDQQIVDMWNLIFGSQDDHPMVDGDVKGDLFIAVKGLVSFHLSLNLCYVIHHTLLRSSVASPPGFTNSLQLPRKPFPPSSIIKA